MSKEEDAPRGRSAASHGDVGWKEEQEEARTTSKEGGAKAAKVAALKAAPEAPPVVAASVEEELLQLRQRHAAPKRSVMEVHYTGAGKPVVTTGNRRKTVAVRSLCCLHINSCPRRLILQLVESKWCDRLILLCIVVNSVLLALEKHRAPADDPMNVTIEYIGHGLSGIFLAECVLKIAGWGFCIYVSDAWNMLDLVVVISAVIEWIPAIPFGGLGFLRLFRVLRPLRSLNAVPEMKVLVNTTVAAVPRLGNVAALGAFIFVVFAIIGMTLMQGIFYRECHEFPNPRLIEIDDTWCWSWPKLGDGALCGGEYDCTTIENEVRTVLGFCGGHEFDQGDFAPKFESHLTTVGPSSGGPYDWCDDDSRPMKVAPELDFVHFDHLGGAVLLIFQSMTMEGWTDLMYYVKDSFSFWFAVLYFFMIIVVASHFLLNVALAVVDEVRDDFDGDDEEDDETEEAEGTDRAGGDAGDEEESEEPLWKDCAPVRLAKRLTQSDHWQNFIMFIITANVITMCVGQFPPNVILEHSLVYVGYAFLGIFIVEMIVELIARGCKGYVTYPSTCFDGVVVIISIIETAIAVASGGAGGSALQALRTLRLFRVLNKFASRNPRFAILLKSMVGTAQALKYWLVLFVLVLYICTLMWMHFFANTLQFSEPDDSAGYIGRYDNDPRAPKLLPWCELELDTPLAQQRTSWHYKQDCIPRAHYDNFGWGFVTIFQIMTGENWNAIMYAGMRSTRDNNWEWAFGILYVFLLLFGQTLFLSLFLSMLLAKFDDFRNAENEKFDAEQEVKRAKSRKSMEEFEALEDGAVDGNEEEADTSRPKVAQAWAELPGQVPGGDAEEHGLVSKGGKPSKHDEDDEEEDDEDEDDEDMWSLESGRGWPHGWSWFLFPENFPLRRLANWLLDQEVTIWGSTMKIFDTFILVCILISTMCMIIDFPLADPDNPIIAAVRTLDTVFAVVFITEMGLKLIALPVVWGENAYFWSPGCAWNWLDAVVVSVSIMGFTGGGPSELKTLRILRAFRPLRVVKRLETLRNIVEAIFNSMKELGVLLIVFLLFLLIFALIFMMYLNGTLYACSEGNVWFHRDLGDPDFQSFTMPLCLSNTSLESVMVRGEWDTSTMAWTKNTSSLCGTGDYAAFEVPWQRATPDTPVCVARCDPLWRAEFNSTYAAPADLCPRKYAIAEELPHACSDDIAALPNRSTFQEEVGFLYIAAMQTSYVVPCGGSTAESILGGAYPGEKNSCRSRYCPVVDEDRIESCKLEAELHPHFCVDACSGSADSGACLSCRAEYRAACECPDFCTPLMKDAALCTEQGGAWEQVLSHNFDNVWNSMLTLIEISTTEGWVDAMYAACDTSFSPYVQPLRDTSHPVWMLLFVVWILFSFMFLMNLGVGIIVDKFMEMRAEGKDIISPAQRRWVQFRLDLHTRGYVFILTNLHELPPVRRAIYDLVEHRFFERLIMGCIVFNTCLMATATFPELETLETAWWASIRMGLNYFFAFIFTVEAVLKLIALKKNYWKDSWNRFDFTCVVATILGILVSVMDIGLNISSLASVIRIFRIARLFRLLKFKALRPLNKLFMSMAISLIKLANVGVVAFLFLTLFSILGVALFSTVSDQSDTHDSHGNFRHFPNAFITLFRASTGEAWNEIMHDLHKDEVDWFKAGSWCTPSDLFDTETSYDILKHKCLIDHPNACVMTPINGWSPMPWVYWITYTWVMGLVIMNVVIAVILEGYEDTKTRDEAEIINSCRNLWGSKYDPDKRMKIPFPDALRFIVEAIGILQRDGLIKGDLVNIDLPVSNGNFGVDLSDFPIRFARALDIKPATMVEFHVAAKQVVRFASIVEENERPAVEVIRDLESTDENRKSKDIKRIKRLEAVSPAAKAKGEPFMKHIAAIKIQMRIREVVLRIRNKKAKNLMDLCNVGSGVVVFDSRDEYLKFAVATVELAEKCGVTAPVAG
mmetsp:Transcript_148337/g.385670  ORF Transcript_148337/g.385670 Transcript_148337/m.385670 type:complete len:1949 (-) Transcript_148337:33-5879(-)